MLQASEIPQLTNFYKRLSELMIKNGDFVLHAGELVNTQVGSWFKYQREEAKSFKEAHWLRDESVRRYTTLRKDVSDRKEKLWKKPVKNIYEW